MNLQSSRFYFISNKSGGEGEAHGRGCFQAAPQVNRLLVVDLSRAAGGQFSFEGRMKVSNQSFPAQRSPKS